MRRAEIYVNNVLAGVLSENDNNTYSFVYDDDYYTNPNALPISLTLPKTSKEFHSDFIFSFFLNMLSEGANKKLQCARLKIDEDDYFGLLLATADKDTIGAVTVKELRNG